jgi:hypothetical protein
VPLVSGILRMSPLQFYAADVLPDLPSFIGRVCSGYAPVWGELQTPLV